MLICGPRTHFSGPLWFRRHAFSEIVKKNGSVTSGVWLYFHYSRNPVSDTVSGSGRSRKYKLKKYTRREATQETEFHGWRLAKSYQIFSLCSLSATKNTFFNLSPKKLFLTRNRYFYSIPFHPPTPPLPCLADIGRWTSGTICSTCF